MAYYGNYDFALENAIQRETSSLYQNYGLSRSVLHRIKTFYKFQPKSLGDSSKVIGFLSGIFDDYGYDKESFSKFLSTYTELISCNPAELERKVIILNTQGLLETVLFTKPYALLDTNHLSSLNLYAVGRNLKNDGIKLNYENVYGVEYSLSQLESLRRLYPLKVAKYNFFQLLFEKKREELRRQNKTSLSLKEKD